MEEAPSSSSATGSGSNSGCTEFQMNLLLQLQQNMLNFQSQLTEFSLKLIQLETQQQKMSVKLENTAESVQCQVSSSSSSVAVTGPALHRTVINDISVLTGRVTNLEDKLATAVHDIYLLAERVRTFEKKVQEQLQSQQQGNLQPQTTATVAAPTVFVKVSGGGDDAWNHAGQQQVIKVLDESQLMGTNYGWNAEEAVAMPTSLDDNLGLGLSGEPEMIISEFDQSSFQMLSYDEAYGPPHQSIISNISQNTAGSYSGSQRSRSPPPGPAPAKSFQGNTWFFDKLGRRHDFVVSDGRRFMCPDPDCSSNFSNKPYLTRHFNEKHCDPTKHKCAFCELIIDIGTDRGKLMEHVRRHEEENEANDRRGITFMGAAMSSSTATAGAEQQPPQRFSCKVCPNTFAKAENLACHYTISHYQGALDHNLAVD